MIAHVHQDILQYFAVHMYEDMMIPGMGNNEIALHNFHNHNSPSSNWTLNVRPVNVPFGDSTIHISIKGPSGYANVRNIPNSQFPSTSFDMPGDQFPTGYSYQVCASSGALGFVLPHCEYFIHGQGDRQVVVSPR